MADGNLKDYQRPPLDGLTEREIDEVLTGLNDKDHLKEEMLAIYAETLRGQQINGAAALNNIPPPPAFGEIASHKNEGLPKLIKVGERKAETEAELLNIRGDVLATLGFGGPKDSVKLAEWSPADKDSQKAA